MPRSRCAPPPEAEGGDEGGQAEFRMVVGRRGKKVVSVATGERTLAGAQHLPGAAQLRAALRPAQALSELQRLRRELRACGAAPAAQLAVRSALEQLRAERTAPPAPEGSSTAVRITCLGLGSVCGSPSSRVQLALFLELCDGLPVPAAGPADCFDPCLTADDKGVLRSLGITTAARNVEGCVPLGGGRELHLLFMPHCCRSLYANLLWANWSAEALSSVVVVGNGLGAYCDKALGKEARLAVEGMARLRPAMRSIALHPYPGEPGALSDTDVQWWPPSALGELLAARQSLWAQRPPRPPADHEMAAAAAPQSRP